MNKAWLFFTAVTGFFWFGFILHSSSGLELLLGRYSVRYAIGLLCLTVVWLSALVFAWHRRTGLTAWLKTVFGNALIAVILAFLVLPPAYIYLHHHTLKNDVFAPLNKDAHAFFQNDVTPLNLSCNEGEFKVLAIGGSTTHGGKLGLEHAYPTHLQVLLRKSFPGRKIRVLNAGVPGHTSLHSLLRYVSRFFTCKPDAVIVMHAFNDIYQTSEGSLTTGSYREDYGHFFGPMGNRVNPKDRFARNIREALRKNWFVRTWYSDLRGNNIAVTPVTERPAVDLLRPLPTFRRNLARLAHIASYDGATVILMTQPYNYQANISTPEEKALLFPYHLVDHVREPTIAEQIYAMDAFNQAAREVAMATNSIIVDLEPRIEKSTNMMYDGLHYTEEGAQAVASVVIELVPWKSLIEGREL